MALNDEVLGYLQQAMPQLVVAAAPRWLKSSHWRPALCLRLPPHPLLLAVDVIPSATLPLGLYEKEVGRLLRDHKTLRAAVCVLEEGFEDNPRIEKLCRRLGVGLKVLAPGLGLQTVVPIDLDPPPITAPLPTEEGWFPEAILAQSQGLTNLVFAQTLDAFVDQVKASLGDDRATLEHVRNTIDHLLQQHPGFRANVGQFMRLSNFEALLRTGAPDETEHVFHSFRVFLAGCPVINQFHQHFRAAQERFCGGEGAPVCVEYAWLLTSLFHDIGRAKERDKAVKLFSQQIDDDDIEIALTPKPVRWERDHWRDAIKAIGSLAVFVAGDGEAWDGATIGDAEGNKIGSVWAHLYDELRRHSIISAFDFLASIIEKEAAVGERTNRRFVMTHAVPAALSILLHDWRLWPQAKEQGLFPINGLRVPMAALLIFLDTWDDYRRKGPDPVIHVRNYVISPQGVRAEIEWGDTKAYESEKIKYEAFKQAVTQMSFEMTINVRLPEAQ